MSDPRNELPKLRAKIRDLQTLINDGYPTTTKALPDDFVFELATLISLTHQGARRPDDLGYVTKGHADWRAPHTDTELKAGTKLKEYQAELGRLAKRIRTTNHTLAGSGTTHPLEDAELARHGMLAKAGSATTPGDSPNA